MAEYHELAAEAAAAAVLGACGALARIAAQADPPVQRALAGVGGEFVLTAALRRIEDVILEIGRAHV